MSLNEEYQDLIPGPAKMNLVEIGLVGRPHGLRGGFFVKPLVGRNIVETTPLFLQDAMDKSKSLTVFLDTVETSYVVERAYVSQERLVLRLVGLDRQAIEKLYDHVLCVPRSFLKVAHDEVLVKDLLGCTVVAADYGVVGHVVRVGSFGAQDNLEIQLAANQEKKLSGTEVVYYPYLDTFILQIDLHQKKITIQYVPEFLDPHFSLEERAQ